MNRPSTRPMVIAMIGALTLLGGCSTGSASDDPADSTTTTTVLFIGGGSGIGGGTTPDTAAAATEDTDADDGTPATDENDADDLGRSDVPLPADTTGLSPECQALLDYFETDQDGIDLAIDADEARDQFDAIIPRLRDDIQPAALTYTETVARGFDLIATYGSWDEMMDDEAGVLAWSDIFFLNTEYNEAYEALRAHLDEVCPPTGD